MTSDFVLITDCDLPGTAAEDTLRAAGLRVERAPSRSAADIITAGRGATALIVQWAPITAEIMDALPELRFISRLGIGYDMIDVDAATARGIQVANTPTYCIEEVATHTLAMILALGRGLGAYDRAVRAGTWSAVAARPLAVRPSASTVAVIGYGRIGRLVASSCTALGFRVIVSDPVLDEPAARAAGHIPVTLAAAIAEADILTLHAPLTAQTRHMINAEALATMRPGAVLVNTCRGPLVDEEALAAALGSGALAGAALDVFGEEPLPTSSPLRGLENVLLTPHAAWYSPESLADLPVHAARNVVEYCAGAPVPAVVNRESLTTTR